MDYRNPFLFILAALSICAVSCGTDDAQRSTDTPLYAEQHRPKIHFSPPRMWMNDPNGLVYLDGEYHLFYQHYPGDIIHGPMHWGHAVSGDLLHWTHLPIALAPDSLGEIFSGGAVYDEQNTSGLGTADSPPLVAIFTHHDSLAETSGQKDYQVQSIAYSTDKGRTWHKYSGNPVLENPGIADFRDPNVIWHDETGQWVMALAVYDRIRFYSSPDLKEWTQTGEFGEGYGTDDGVWECPDLFTLRLNGKEKWILLVSVNHGAPNGGSGTFYFTGNFDGRTFIPDPHYTPNRTGNGQLRWIDYGRDDYAGVTWFNAPGGRRIFLGWMSNWDYSELVPTKPWRNAMTLPRELSLADDGQGPILITHPVQETESLRSKSFAVMSINLLGEWSLSDRMDFPPSPVEVQIEFAKRQGSEVALVMRNDTGEVYSIGFNADEHVFFSDRTAAGPNTFSPGFARTVHTAPRISNADIVRLHLYLDVSSAELFADNGTTVMTETFFPTIPFDQIYLSVKGVQLEIRRATVHALQPVWTPEVSEEL